MSEDEKLAHSNNPSNGSATETGQKISSGQVSPRASDKDIERQEKPVVDDGPPDGGLKAWLTVAGA
jgi:hypothetical protein